MCRLDAREEMEDEAAWPKANPRLNYSPELRLEYRADVREWRRNPLRHPMTPTKRFNMPEERRDVAVTDYANLVAASRPVDVDALRGRPCVVGIDYAKTNDMVGAVALFKVGGEYQVIPYAWWCTRSSDADAVRAPLAEWAGRGIMRLVDDVEVPPGMVARWVAGIATAYDVRMVALDSFRYALLAKALAEVGFDGSERGEGQRVWLTRPSDVMRVQPVIDSAFSTRSIAWGESPLMRWATNNAKLEPAPNNCYKFGKIEPHSRKTDPFMALVHAFTVADRIPDDMASEPFAEPLFF